MIFIQIKWGSEQSACSKFRHHFSFFLLGCSWQKTFGIIWKQIKRKLKGCTVKDVLILAGTTWKCSLEISKILGHTYLGWHGYLTRTRKYFCRMVWARLRIDKKCERCNRIGSGGCHPKKGKYSDYTVTLFRQKNVLSRKFESSIKIFFAKIFLLKVAFVTRR